MRIGLGDGENIQVRREAPKRSKMTKTNSTSSKKANFATMLFDSRKSLVPDKYLLDENWSNPLGPSDTRANWELIAIYLLKIIV